MNHLDITRQLTVNKEVFSYLFEGVNPHQYTWKPRPEKWCMLEVLCHLHDEEREDFRARVKSVLKDPQQPLSPIDPQGWVVSRNYMEQNYQRMLDSFLKERDTSIDYLHSLSDPKWENAYQHPKLGAMPASLFLNNWLAHDLLHIRQITALKYQYHQAHSADKLDYAGAW